ncbi:MAG: hypothetical protein ABFS09_12290 [Thermodesulfobacteriota bacterium]
MKTAKSLFFPLLMVLTFATVALAEPQTTCPVMGGTVNEQLYADHDGQRVYFCCAYCDGQFKKDPQKYLDKLQEQGQEPKAVPKG